MKNSKKMLLDGALVVLVSAGLIIFSPDTPTSFAKQSEKKQFTNIIGIITSEKGLALEGAKVTAKNLSTKEESHTKTKKDGSYTISNLKPGIYQVKVTANGFKLTIMNNVVVSQSINPTVNIILQLGSTSEAVELTLGTIQYLQDNNGNQPSANNRKILQGLSAVFETSPQIVNTPNRTDAAGSGANGNNLGGGGLIGPVASGALVGSGASALSLTTGVIGTSMPLEKPKLNTEGYKNYGVNPWTDTKKDHFSTFAVDVDTGSYTIARRKLNEGVLPPIDSVRVEEFVNYFKYQYPAPVTKHPFSVTMEASTSPFDEKHYLLRIGLKGRGVAQQERPTAHLTFLVDTSGSMQSEDKIGLVKKSLKMLVNHLQPQDTVAITTYAGGVSLVLPPTQVSDKSVILNAIDELQSEGSTAMEAGIDLAYKQALNALQPESINRVIICSDGDANIGKTTPEENIKQIESYVEQGITVSTIGFGMGNYKDTMMEQFANKGNGNYYYVDGVSQAKRIFVEQLTGTLQVIAKDVKVQVEFNPASVLEYRLVGYENRDIADEDFRNDEVDAGEIGAGHTVTAIYEVKLQKQPTKDLATVRLRYKSPDANKKTPAQEVVAGLDLSRIQQNFSETSEDFRFSIAVAAFAEVLRNSQAAKTWSLDKIANIAETALQSNNKERQECFQLVKKAQQLKLVFANSSKP